MCIYICIHVPICVCVHVCAGMCVHACVHRCLCICVWTHMCNVYIPRYWTSHPVQKYPSQLADCLQSGGVFLLEILWPDTIPMGGLGMPTMPSPYSFSTWQTPEEARAEWPWQKTLFPPKAIRGLTEMPNFRRLKESCLSKYSWLAVLFTHKFSQSTWGDFCLKKKGSGYKRNLPCRLSLSVGWPGVYCRFSALATFLKTGRKFRKLSLCMYCHAAFSHTLFCQKLYMQIRSNFFFPAHCFSFNITTELGG